MPLHHVAAERSSRRRRQFEVYGRPRSEQREGSAGHGFGSQIGMKTRRSRAGLDIQRSQAHTADRDAVAGAQPGAWIERRCGNGNAPRTVAAFDGEDSARGFYQPGKHIYALT